MQDCYDRCGLNGSCSDDSAKFDGASSCTCNMGIAGEVSDCSIHSTQVILGRIDVIGSEAESSKC